MWDIDIKNFTVSHLENNACILKCPATFEMSVRVKRYGTPEEKKEEVARRDCTGRPFLGFLGFGLFGKITRVLGRVFGLLLSKRK